MKYALVIPDGAADEPQDSLGGKTPLQAANLPNMDVVASGGIVGQANHVPDSMPSGSDVGTMSLFGYDPLEFHTGRAPLEAAAQGIELGLLDWAVRCNVVELADGKMKSFTAEQIASDLAKSLLELLQKEVAASGQWQFVPGVSYRNLLIYRGKEGEVAPFDATTETTPPHDITDQAYEPSLPKGTGSGILKDLMSLSQKLFPGLEANAKLAEETGTLANSVWLWGQGSRPKLIPFDEKYGVEGAVITAVDLLRGIGRLIGWDVVEVPGATGYLDTDYTAKGKYAIDTLESGKDFVVVHVEASDEASHEGNVQAKIDAFESIDQHIVGPLHEYLKDQGDYRLLICPDHPTFLRTKTHSHGFVPFSVCGTGIDADSQSTYDEVSAEGGSVKLAAGYELMDLIFKKL